MVPIDDSKDTSDFKVSSVSALSNPSSKNLFEVFSHSSGIDLNLCLNLKYKAESTELRENFL